MKRLWSSLLYLLAVFQNNTYSSGGVWNQSKLSQFYTFDTIRYFKDQKTKRKWDLLHFAVHDGKLININ